MTNSHSTNAAVLTVVCIAASATLAVAQQPTGDEPLTRKEFARFLEEYRQFQEDYGKLSRENERLRAEVAELKAGARGATREDWRSELRASALEEREMILEELREEIHDVADPLRPGMTNLTVGGAAVVTYQDLENADSTFGLGVAPLLLWKPNDRVLLEAEFGFGLNREDTSVDLGLAQLSYIVNDYATIGAGLFRNPFLTFWPRWHPSWINKAANIPLIYDRGLVGPGALGIQIRGGAPVGPAGKVNYALYYVNGPKFKTTQVSAGRLDPANNRDNNNNKGFGGRIGFLPVAELEFGYSFFTGKVGDSGSDFSRVDAFMHGVDLAYAREFEAIRGRIDLRAEAVWIDAGNVIFFGSLDPFTFDNKRNGWFAQAAYRPTLVDRTLGSGIEMKNFEFVARYDQLREPGPGVLGVDRDRLTLGVDYWIRPSVVVKAAYAHDDLRGGKDQDGVFMQFAVGF